MGGGTQNSCGYTRDAHSSSCSETLSTNQNESACLTSTQMFHSFLFKLLEWANFWGRCFFCFTLNGCNYRNNYFPWNIPDYKREKTCSCCIHNTTQEAGWEAEDNTNWKRQANENKLHSYRDDNDEVQISVSGVIAGCGKWHMNNH